MLSENLTEPERSVWEAFPRSGCVDLRAGDPSVDDPAKGGCWEVARTVRSEVIRALVLGGPTPEQGAVAGVRIIGARITGSLDLAHAEVRCPLNLEQCWFEEPPDLHGAVTRYVDLRGSCLPSVMADNLRVEGSLILTGCHLGEKPGTPAASRSAVGSSSKLQPGRALSAMGITVGAGVFMNDGFTADGEICLIGGHIAGQLNLNGARLDGQGGVALSANRLTVDGPVFCRNGFAAEGELTFRRMHITGFLDLSGALIANPGGRAFFAPVLTVDAGMYCIGTEFAGEVNLIDAHITEPLDLSRTTIDNPGKTAMVASRLTIEGPFFGRDGFTVRGELVLRRARITSFLDFSSACLDNPDGYAFFAPGLTVESASFRDGTVLNGQVCLNDARITGDLDLAEARLTGTAKDALTCAHLNARQLTMPQTPLPGTADLSHARIGSLNAHPNSTPAGLRVSELTYDKLTPLLPAGQRVRWLTSAHDEYLPQPYEQLAITYRRLGHDAGARTVLLAKERHRHSTMTLPIKLWGLLQDVTIGYGFRSGRAGLWLIGLVSVGTIAFGLHHPLPAKSTEHPQFNPFVYTLDLLLPVINYGQQSAFAPTGGYQWLSYILITAGWILATTIITGISRALYRS